MIVLIILVPLVILVIVLLTEASQPIMKEKWPHGKL